MLGIKSWIGLYKRQDLQDWRQIVVFTYKKSGGVIMFITTYVDLFLFTNDRNLKKILIEKIRKELQNEKLRHCI